MLCSTESTPVSNLIVGSAGASYGAEIPVNSGISPARAFLYSPLGSRRSQTARSAAQRSHRVAPV